MSPRKHTDPTPTADTPDSKSNGNGRAPFAGWSVARIVKRGVQPREISHEFKIPEQTVYGAIRDGRLQAVAIEGLSGGGKPRLFVQRRDAVAYARGYVATRLNRLRNPVQPETSA